MASYTDLKNEETLYADIDQYPRYIKKEEKKKERCKTGHQSMLAFKGREKKKIHMLLLVKV